MTSARELFKKLGYVQIHDYDDMHKEDGNFIVYLHDDQSQIWFYEETKSYYVENWDSYPMLICTDLAYAIFTQLKELGWIK